jgi:hypothetical protein
VQLFNMLLDFRCGFKRQRQMARQKAAPPLAWHDGICTTAV